MKTRYMTLHSKEVSTSKASVIIYLLTIFSELLSSQPLREKSTTAKATHVYFLPSRTAGCFIHIWICQYRLHEDGFSSCFSFTFTNQVSKKARRLNWPVFLFNFGFAIESLPMSNVTLRIT